MKTLVTVGRGGTGKSSFTALMAKNFIEAGQAPLLLVYAHPDQNLGEMIGVDLKEVGKSTIADLIVSTFIEKGVLTVGVPPRERIESRIWETASMKAKASIFFRLAPNGLKDAIGVCPTPPLRLLWNR